MAASGGENVKWQQAEEKTLKGRQETEESAKVSASAGEISESVGKRLRNRLKCRQVA